MTQTEPPKRPQRGRLAALADAYAARVATRRHGVTGFTSQPAPKAIGSPAMGRRLLGGHIVIDGRAVPVDRTDPFARPPDGAEGALQAFGWLDDLAALNRPEARAMAQAWTASWLARHGTGRGPGWTPGVVGRRQIRLIVHPLFLLNGMDSATSRGVIDTLGRQAAFLARRWRTAPPGLPRIGALAARVQSAAALAGLEAERPGAAAALATLLPAEIDAGGAIPSRNPEELSEIFALLQWTAEVLAETGRQPDAALAAALARIAPTLRALRHADGGLARFHGGGRGRPGLLDRTLRASGLPPVLPQGPAMGYARLAAGEVTVIADAAPPPATRAAQASTLAIQVTDGGQPLIVSAGAGTHLGPAWRRAGRASPSHTTLVLDGYSSSRSGPRGRLTEGPASVTCARIEGALEMSHDGWRATHGLVHHRRLALGPGGRDIAGEDRLLPDAPADRARLERVLGHAGGALPYTLHFLLHPEVEPALDMGGHAVSLRTASGAVWVFRLAPDLVPGSGSASLALRPAVYLDARHVAPRAAKQVVVSAALTGYGSAVGWRLTRPGGPPRGRVRRAPRLTVDA